MPTAILAMLCLIISQAGTAFAQQDRAANAALQTPLSRRLDRAERDELLLPADASAGWKIRVNQTSRKAHPIGRRTTFTVRGGFTLVDNLIVPRGAKGGVPANQVIELPAPATQIVGTANRFACVLKSRDNQPAITDILYFDRTTAWGMLPQRELESWNTKITVPITGGPWSGTAVLSLKGHDVAPSHLLLSPTGSRLLSVSNDLSIRLWDLERFSVAVAPGPMGRATHSSQTFGHEIARFNVTLPHEQKNVENLEVAAFAPFGKVLATVNQDTVTFRSPKDGSALFDWQARLPASRYITAIRFDDEGQSLFAFLSPSTESTDATVQFLQFDIDKRRQRDFKGPNRVIDGLALANESLVLTWDGSAVIVAWDMTTCLEKSRVKVTDNRVFDVKLSPAATAFATAGEDGEVKFWSPRTLQLLDVAKPYKHDGVDIIEFSPDGKLIFTGSDNGTLESWDAPEFCWDQRPVPKSIEGNNVKEIIERLSDGTERRISSEGDRQVVTEIAPTGDVKIYSRR
jgi:WD40 repeat protein